MRRVILVVGPNHSGTSAIAKLLLNNGGITGELDGVHNESIPYNRYEDKFFRAYCRDILRIESTPDDTEHLDRYMDRIDIPGDKFLVFKYPKAALIIQNVFHDIDFDKFDVRLVYCLRNYSDVLMSDTLKAKTTPVRVAELNDRIYRFAMSASIPVHIACYERILVKDEIHANEIMNFCIDESWKSINFQGIGK